MSAFQRKLDILQFVPAAPRKVTSRQIFENLKNSGHINIDMRSVQRDLVNLEKVGLFGLESDKRGKPYGWNINASLKKLNLSLMDGNTALAFKVLEQSGATLPNSTLIELTPYFNKATQIVNQNDDSLFANWLKSVSYTPVSSVLLPPEIDALSFEKIKNALFFKKQISADINRLFARKKYMEWKHYDKINPMGLLEMNGQKALFCTFGTLHIKRYKLPLHCIKNVTVLDTDCQQALQSHEGSHSLSIENGEEIEIELLIKDNALFLLQGYKLSEDQILLPSTFQGKSLLVAKVRNNTPLKVFLRGLGENIEVLKPAELREDFAQLSERLYQTYHT